MRSIKLSVLCAVLQLLYLPRPAAAQFNPSLSPMPQTFARKLASPAKLMELQTGAGSGAVGTDAELMDKVRRLLQRRDAEQGRAPISIRIEPSFEAGRCAHIDIIPAPDVDAKMIKEIPKNFASNMPMLQGPQSCCGDFLGVVVIPRAAPLVRPGQIGDLQLKPGTPIFIPKP
jgi:hypothetical protein